MAFDPLGNAEVTLSGKSYRVRSLGITGALSTKALRMLGGHAQVYQLLDLDNGKPYALKVMLPVFRSRRLVRNRGVLSQLAPIPGFEACKHLYFTPETHPDDLARYPDLAYASLMPWVQGTTWTAVVGVDSEMEIDQQTSWELAYQFLALSRLLERNRLAHCDLSGGNVIVDLDKHKVTLIDFDEVFWAGAPRPALEPTGTPGYRKIANSQYRSAGDRFATAVLVAEMLGWRDETVRSRSSGDSFFTDEDCAKTDSARYKLLEEFLDDLYPELGELFRRAWEAPTVEECPSVDEWRMAVMLGRGWRTMPLDPRDRVRVILPAPVEPPPEANGAAAIPVSTSNAPTQPTSLQSRPVGGTGGRQLSGSKIRKVKTPANPRSGRKRWPIILGLLLLSAIVIAALLYFLRFY